MKAKGGPFTAAVNIQSVDGSEVSVCDRRGSTPPDIAGLTALPMGMTEAARVSRAGWRWIMCGEQMGGEPMITKAQMTLVADESATRRRRESARRSRQFRTAKATALENAVVTLLNMTIADKDGVIYAFGSA